MKLAPSSPAAHSVTARRSVKSPQPQLRRGADSVEGEGHAGGAAAIAERRVAVSAVGRHDQPHGGRLRRPRAPSPRGNRAAAAKAARWSCARTGGASKTAPSTAGSRARSVSMASTRAVLQAHFERAPCLPRVPRARSARSRAAGGSRSPPAWARAAATIHSSARRSRARCSSTAVSAGTPRPFRIARLVSSEVMCFLPQMSQKSGVDAPQRRRAVQQFVDSCRHPFERLG